MRFEIFGPAIALCCLFSSNASAADRAKTSCDVISHNFCFAMTSGDEVTVRMPVDFTLYLVRLGSNKKEVTVYSGFAPDLPDYPPVYAHVDKVEKTELYVQNLVGSKKVDLHYEKKFKDGLVSSLHIRTSYSAVEKNQLISFLDSFRKCDSPKTDTIKCKVDPIFTDAAKKL